MTGPHTGHWIDPEDGKHHEDEVLTVEVACESTSENLRAAEAIVLQIGRRLKQKAMYFEVAHFGGTRFLRVDDEKTR